MRDPELIKRAKAMRIEPTSATSPQPTFAANT